MLLYRCLSLAAGYTRSLVLVINRSTPQRTPYVKALILEILTVIPINKIKVPISEPGPLNTNTKLVIVA